MCTRAKKHLTARSHLDFHVLEAVFPENPLGRLITASLSAFPGTPGHDPRKKRTVSTANSRRQPLARCSRSVWREARDCAPTVAATTTTTSPLRQQVMSPLPWPRPRDAPTGRAPANRVARWAELPAAPFAARIDPHVVRDSARRERERRKRYALHVVFYVGSARFTLAPTLSRARVNYAAAVATSRRSFRSLFFVLLRTGILACVYVIYV